MNAEHALRLAEQHQAHLRGDLPAPPLRTRSGHSRANRRPGSARGARRAAGFLLVEVGLKLAVAAAPAGRAAPPSVG